MLLSSLNKYTLNLMVIQVLVKLLQQNCELKKMDTKSSFCFWTFSLKICLFSNKRTHEHSFYLRDIGNQKWSYKIAFAPIWCSLVIRFFFQSISIHKKCKSESIWLFLGPNGSGEYQPFYHSICFLTSNSTCIKEK